MRYWLLVFSLLLSLQTEALVKHQELPKQKQLYIEILNTVQGAYQWPEGKGPKWQHLGHYSVFPRQMMTVPTNMPIYIIGPEKEQEIAMELYDATDTEEIFFLKDISLFYYYQGRQHNPDDTEFVLRNPLTSEPQRFFYPYNPNLENSKIYEVRLYKIENFRKIKLLLKYRFYTLDKNSQFVP